MPSGADTRLDEYSGSRYFHARLPHDPRRAPVWKEICRYLERRYIPDTSTVLDLGAGYGEFINQVRAARRLAVDVTADLASHFDPGVQLHVHSSASIPSIDDATVDVVFASNLLEHLAREDVKKTLAEVARILKIGGTLILLQPNFKYCVSSYFDDYTHIQVFTHVSLADLLLASGFELVTVKARFLPFSMKTRLPKNRLLVRAYLASPVKPFARQMLLVARTPKLQA